MKELYIVETSYIPTAAATNRLFAFGLSLVRKGVRVVYIYLIPNDSFDKSVRYTDVFEFVYLWDGNTIKNKFWCALWSLLKLRKMMSPEIPVYVYSSLNFFPFICRKGFKVYHEYTENPNVVGRINNFFGDWFYKQYIKALHIADCIFVITPSLKNLYVKAYGVPSDKIEVLNMVVDPRRFDKLEDIELQDEISYCGIISEYKDGIMCLIESFSKFSTTHLSYKLNLYGNFENEDIKNKVLNSIEKFGLLDKVNLSGLVSPEEMPLLLKKSKILALARPDNEQAKYGFATKVGEYLLTERPVVITDVGDFNLFLKDKVDVIMAKPDDSDNFAEKLSWVADHYIESEIIGKEGRKTALKLFNPEIETEKIYKRIFDDFVESI